MLVGLADLGLVVVAGLGIEIEVELVAGLDFVAEVELVAEVGSAFVAQMRPALGPEQAGIPVAFVTELVGILVAVVAGLAGLTLEPAGILAVVELIELAGLVDILTEFVVQFAVVLA